MEDGRTVRDRRSRGQLLLGAAVVATGATLAWTGGVAGAGVAALLAVVWFAAGTPYAFAVGQTGLVVGLGGGPTTTPVPQAALVGLLLLDAAVGWDLPTGTATLAVTAAATAVLLAIGQYLAGPVVSGIGILAVTALAVYTIHRYERLTLELVGEPE